MGQTHNRPKKPGVDDVLRKASVTGRMHMRNQKLEKLPPKLYTLTNLKTLDVSNNKLTVISSQIGCLTKLQSLKLSHNLLTELPEELYYMNQLETLNADHNLLKKVPALPRKKLRSIDISHNHIEGEIGHPVVVIPPCAQTVNLSNNKITGLSKSFGFELLAKLRELNLDDNQITQLPEEVKHLKKLICIKLKRNKLVTGSIPKQLLEDTLVNRIELEGNEVDLKCLSNLSGYDAFMARRKLRIDSTISAGISVVDKD
mmetsp:Transcript_3379/g.4254  ORF Transcript_3379/g.4254 Transcript_3379/m.4254 type:complete len:258 (-) Transcript_3379:295-1068(-)